ncbi:MAG: DUF1802 family protein [Gloeobacteraceae cyanobacterium ES-bin-144]|nr:DUF1802 family protein [Verrucomicrobiales bacterium]
MESSIGFKEWQVVCDALASGRQSIILRKGGIHEGRQGFSFAHQSFFLFPTRFHTQTNQIREGNPVFLPEWKPGDEIQITHHAEAVWARTLTDWNQLTELEPLHIYAENTVRERFDWQGKGMASGSIHIALVRVYELTQPWKLNYETSFGGCRSWINLPSPAPACKETATPVLNDQAFEHLNSLLSNSAIAQTLP